MLALAFTLLATDSSDDTTYSSTPENPQRVRISYALAQRLRARDREAYNELIATAFEPLVAIAASIVGSQDAAEDVVQDVLVWLWERGDAWDPGLTPAAYVIGAVRHRALNVVRTRTTETRYAPRVAEGYVANPGTDWEAEARDLEAVLQRAIASLTEHQRTAFLLRVQERMTIAEVASTLEIGVRAAEKLLSRTIRHLRAALEQAIA